MLSPRGIMAWYWVLFIAATLWLYDGNRTSVVGVLVILAGVAAFTFGVLIATLGPPRPRVVRDAALLRSSSLVRLVLIGVGCNLAAAALALRQGGFGLASVLSTNGLLTAANSLAIARYSDASTGSPLVSLLLAMGYAAALAAPFLALTDLTQRRRLLTAAPVLSVLVYSIVTTARLPMLIAVALSAGGVISTTVLRQGRAPRLRMGAVIKTAAALTAVGLAFTLIAAVRTGRVNNNVIGSLWHRQEVYAFGSLPAFSVWYEESYDRDQRPLLGTATVAGVGPVLGTSRAATRAYGDFEIVDAQGSRSNVYTIFRGLILDFSESGALFVLALAGFGFGRAFRAARGGSVKAAAVLACGYGIILLSNSMAITTFTNVAVGMVVGGVWLAREARLARELAAAPAPEPKKPTRPRRTVRA